MTNGTDNTRKPLIWVLLDDRAGNRSQCLGVAKLLGLDYEVRELEYTAMAALPNFLKGATFTGLTRQSANNLHAPWPDLVIAAGRRTASIARAIKRHSKGCAHLVQIMHPGQSGLADFDIVCVPRHDKPRPARHGETNILYMTGAPHGITPDVIDAAALTWGDKFAHLPRPRIAVFVGGSTRRKEFTVEMGRTFGQLVDGMARDAGGSLLITTSRRSGVAGQAVVAEISVPHMAYHWGDGGDNPYLGYLAVADAIVVTGDSVSMCSEACATNVPVYIFAPKGFVTDKHDRLHQFLYDQGYARALEGAFVQWNHPALNAAGTIAEAIRNRYGFTP